MWFLTRGGLVLLTAWMLLLPGYSLAQESQEVQEQAAPAVAPDAERAGKITKSRSNIQNNREIQPAESGEPVEPTTEASGEQLLKTKTKSNQSND